MELIAAFPLHSHFISPSPPPALLLLLLDNNINTPNNTTTNSGTPPPSGKYPGPTHPSAPSSRPVHTTPGSLSGKRLPPPPLPTILGDWEEDWGREQQEQVGRGSGRRLKRLGRIALVVSRWSRMVEVPVVCWLGGRSWSTCNDTSKEINATYSRDREPCRDDRICEIERELTNAMRDPLLIFNSACGLHSGRGSGYQSGRQQSIRSLGLLMNSVRSSLVPLVMERSRC